MHAGQLHTARRTFTQSEFDRFAALSGDDNPIHVDPGFSARTHFGRTVAHGMLLYTALCGALEQLLPGALPLEQDFMFPNPTYAGEAMALQLEVRAWSPETRLATVDMAIRRADGTCTCEGAATVALDAEAWGAARAAVPPEPLAPDPGTPFKGFAVGQAESVTRSFTAADLAEYAALAGITGRAQVTVPGPLIGGLFSYLLGTRLPGRGTNYLKQHYRFLDPACAGTALTASVTISRLRPDKELVNLRTECADAAGAPVCTGGALVLARDVRAG